MMDFAEIRASIVDQDKGVEIDILDPIQGKPTGIKFRIAGPDSERQHQARLEMADEYSEYADLEGRVKAEHREMVRLNTLAKCVLGWKIQENGKSIPFNHANVVRVLKAGTWLQQQVDVAANDRSLFTAHNFVEGVD